MSWSLGYDNNWKRDIGYGVPAWCDYPQCKEKIDRGLSFVCGGRPYGGDSGCGLYFCGRHLSHVPDPEQIELGVDEDNADHIQLCERCIGKESTFEPKPEHPTWVRHKLKDPSWAQWRKDNDKEVEALAAQEGTKQ